MKAYELLKKFTEKLIEVFAYHGQQLEIIGIPTEEEVIEATNKYHKCPDKDCIDFDPFDDRDWGYEFHSVVEEELLANGIIIKKSGIRINGVDNDDRMFLCQDGSGFIEGVSNKNTYAIVSTVQMTPAGDTFGIIVKPSGDQFFWRKILSRKAMEEEFSKITRLPIITNDYLTNNRYVWE